MAVTETKGIKGVIVHPQWGVPMGFHTLARADFDFANGSTYVTLSGYYSKEVAESGGQPMYNSTAHIDGAVLSDETGVLQSVISSPDSPLASGVVTVYNKVPVEV